MTPLSASEERELMKAFKELLERLVVSRLDSIEKRVDGLVQRMDRMDAEIEEFRSRRRVM